MINTFEKVEDLISHVKDYIKYNIELAEIKSIEMISAILSNLFLLLTLFFIFLLTFIFLGISIAFAFSNVLDSYFFGFLMVSFMFIILGIIFWVKRNSLINKPIIKLVIRYCLNQKK